MNPRPGPAPDAVGRRITDRPRPPHPVAGGRLPAGQLSALVRTMRTSRPVLGVHGIAPVLDAARRRAGATA